MATREGVRPGGRSARVQDSVHRAVRELLAESDRAGVTVPLIAARAGVTPSTIYRRWGDLQELLADVAVERFKPDSQPADTGSLRGDLNLWAEQFLEEMFSVPGRTMVNDVLGSARPNSVSCQCSEYIQEQIQIIVDRAAARGEPAPAAAVVMDRLVAPIMYRLLFRNEVPPPGYARELVEASLGAL